MIHNLFDGDPMSPGWERFELLAGGGPVQVVRIVSGVNEDPGPWYDQSHHEWVMVLKGRGVLEFADGRQEELGPGDALPLPPHMRHRVASTTDQTVWLAVHWTT